MVLQELLLNTEIHLEIIQGEKKFEIPSKVVGTDANGIYIPVFTAGGRTLDFSGKEFSGMVYNLYCVDKRYTNRYCWRTVSIAVRKWQGKDCYLITSASFGKIGKEEDRRTDFRIDLDIPCGTTAPDEKDELEITLKNVSNEGLAIYAKKDFMEIGSVSEIKFQDEVGDHKFELKVQMKCIRKKPADAGYLFGCTIIEQSKEWITYVFLKGLRKKVSKGTDEIRK